MIKKHNEYEIYKIVATYKIFRVDTPSDLKIDVIQYENGKYEGCANYSFWSIGQFDPYQRNVPNSETAEGAVKEVLDSLDKFKMAQYSKTEYCWVPFENYKDFVILGSGEKITRKEFLEINNRNK